MSLPIILKTACGTLWGVATIGVGYMACNFLLEDDSPIPPTTQTPVAITKSEIMYVGNNVYTFEEFNDKLTFQQDNISCPKDTQKQYCKGSFQDPWNTSPVWIDNKTKKLSFYIDHPQSDNPPTIHVIVDRNLDTHNEEENDKLFQKISSIIQTDIPSKSNK